MIDYVVYGKIIIDDIRLLNGDMVYNVLGGGGPQAAFGARLWSPSVGILTRTGGTGFDASPRAELENIGIDLQGWMSYEHLDTPHGLMAYDQNEYMVGYDTYETAKNRLMANMAELLAQVIPIPNDYQDPKVIHLVTEYMDEPMADEALKMKKNGSIYSLEPIIDYRSWWNRKQMLDYFPNIDVVTPDWPSASGMAESDDPKEVLEFWTKLGCACVAIRDGARGSYVWDKFTNKKWHVPIVKVKAIDPTGCGNSYGGGLSVSWDIHRNAREAACCATVSASYLAKNIGLPPVTESLEKEARELWEGLLKEVEEM